MKLLSVVALAVSVYAVSEVCAQAQSCPACPPSCELEVITALELDMVNTNQVVRTARDQVLLKVVLVNKTVSDLRDSIAYLKNASQAALLMQATQFLVMVIYLVIISVMACKGCVEKKPTEIQEEQLELMESRLVERKRKSRAERSKLSPAEE